MKKTFLLIIFCFLTFSFLYADIIYLKDGTKLEGTVIEETDEQVIFDVYGGKVTFLRSEVDRIEKKPVTRGKTPVFPKAVHSNSESTEVREENQPKIPSLETQLNQVVSKIPEEWKGKGKEWLKLFLEKQKDKKPISIRDMDFYMILILLIQMVATLLFTTLVVFGYIWIFDSQTTFWQALWFLVKCNILSNLLFRFASPMFIPEEGKRPEFWDKGGPGILIALAFIVLSTFYFFAKRDFDAGFFKTTGLLIVTVIASAIAGIVCAFFGV